jgi:hypothetical protein
MEKNSIKFKERVVYNLQLVKGPFGGTETEMRCIFLGNAKIACEKSKFLKFKRTIPRKGVPREFAVPRSLIIWAES